MPVGAGRRRLPLNGPVPMREVLHGDLRCVRERLLDGFRGRTMTGDVHTFDSIECAAQRIAPECEYCKCRILGHGSRSRAGSSAAHIVLARVTPVSARRSRMRWALTPAEFSVTLM